ncbi:MAG TPA: ABC transporter permease subunit [Xanthobacteraceae bacterium]|nr:ABC transporter permease subunit [Xanthobacteraceae bacterium]
MARPWESAPGVPFYRDPKYRGIALQIGLCAALGYLAYSAIQTAAENLARSHVASGFGFWNVVAGFDISQTLIDYSPQSSTYGRAFWVGLLNTLVVAALGIVLATILGFTIGVARLSKNFLVERLATGYVELIRNVPLLLQLLFWYNAVLNALPGFAASFVLPGGILLNNRGLFMPRPLFADGTQILATFAVTVLLAALFNKVVGRSAGFWGAIGVRSVFTLSILVGLPIVVFVVVGAPFAFDYPEIGRFNVKGGFEILPEFVALVLGLVIYTAAFIAEVVRAGLRSVPRGQTDAAQALGLTRPQTLQLIVIPQAMRVIIPPLTNQYLNLTKNSSLAVAIGYPDLVQIFTGTVANQTNQPVEIVVLTMLVYLSFSLVTSLVMNFYNARHALVER